MGWSSDFENLRFNPKDPNPWLALYLDQTMPMHDEVKRALLRGHNTRSRRLLLPIVRPLARLTIIIVKLMRMVIPERWNSPLLLHKTIYWGLKTFVQKDASYLILRHFSIGSEMLKFVGDNVEGFQATSTKALFPKELKDISVDAFLIHDLNIFNFIIELNLYLKKEKREIVAPKELNFDAITDDEFPIHVEENGWLNVIDLQTAIELYTPMYSLLLSDHDFWRAANSLQLDEIMAIYFGKILEDTVPLSLVSNRHPMVPNITLAAGFRLMLHGLNAEIMHGYLRKLKRAQATAT